MPNLEWHNQNRPKLEWQQQNFRFKIGEECFRKKSMELIDYRMSRIYTAFQPVILYSNIWSIVENGGVYPNANMLAIF